MNRARTTIARDTSRGKVRCSKESKATYEKIHRGTSKRTKIAALMRRLAIAKYDPPSTQPYAVSERTK